MVEIVVLVGHWWWILQWISLVVFFFSMGLILGWVLVSCGRGCDFACGGGFWTRCGWWVLLGRYIVLMCCVEK